MTRKTIMKNWRKHTNTAFFRIDEAYAGKNHINPKAKTFIACAPFVSLNECCELRGFKTIENAMKAADKKWPL